MKKVLNLTLLALFISAVANSQTLYTSFAANKTFNEVDTAKVSQVIVKDANKRLASFFEYDEVPTYNSFECYKDKDGNIKLDKFPSIVFYYNKQGKHVETVTWIITSDIESELIDIAEIFGFLAKNEAGMPNSCQHTVTAGSWYNLTVEKDNEEYYLFFDSNLELVKYVNLDTDEEIFVPKEEDEDE